MVNLFSNVPTDEVIATVRKRLEEDDTLTERTNIPVEGIVRWKRDRAAAATTQAGAPASRNLPLMAEVNRLHRKVYGSVVLHMTAPGAYRGKKPLHI